MIDNKMFYPKLNSDGLIKTSTDTGKLIVVSDQYAIFNNILEKQLNNANVVFNTEASKTYHLRYSLRGEKINDYTPNKGFYLVDLANSHYNPNDNDSTSSEFDTTYTDMLLAKVVTDEDNNLTVFSYVNLPTLELRLIRTEGGQIYESSGDGEGYHAVVDLDINWSRTPKLVSLGLEGSTKDNTTLQGLSISEPVIINKEKINIALFLHSADSVGEWDNELHTGDYSFTPYWQKRPTITLVLEA